MSDLVENKIKKNWLYTLFVVIAMGLISICYAMFKNTNTLDRLGKNVFVIMLIFQLGFILLWYFLYYRFVYKKPGRKFLMFHLITSPFGFIYSVLLELNLLPFGPKVASFTNYDRGILILGLAIAVVFYFFSLKLFKLNKKIKNSLAGAPKG